MTVYKPYYLIHQFSECDIGVAINWAQSQNPICPAGVSSTIIVPKQEEHYLDIESEFGMSTLLNSVKTHRLENSDKNLNAIIVDVAVKNGYKLNELSKLSNPELITELIYEFHPNDIFVSIFMPKKVDHWIRWIDQQMTIFGFNILKIKGGIIFRDSAITSYRPSPAIIRHHPSDEIDMINGGVWKHFDDKEF